MNTWLAPAKVNLVLAVGPVDDTGYHPLDSVVQTVSLFDRVTVDPADADAIVVSGAEGAADGVPIGPDNLVAVALGALRRHVEVPPVRVEVAKAIPTAAGLGGGSADAAATLVAVAALVGAEVDLVAVAAEVGSDVPALVLGGTVEMAGRGERVGRLPAVVAPRWLVVTPPFGLPTASVYRRWDALGGPTGERKPWPVTEVAVGRPIRNDLEPAAVAERPELAAWLGAVEDVVGRPAMVSGSGSSCFAEVDVPGVEEAAQAHPLLARARLIEVVAPIVAGPSEA